MGLGAALVLCRIPEQVAVTAHRLHSGHINIAALLDGNSAYLFCGYENYLFSFSHFWFATPQLVLQSDWHEVWHSPQPPFLALSQREAVFNVLILSILFSPI